MIVGTVVENIEYFGSFGHFVGCSILAYLHSTCFVADSSYWAFGSLMGVEHCYIHKNYADFHSLPCYFAF